MAEPWQMIPDDTVDQLSNQKKADDWATEQRTKVAQEWGDLHRQDTMAMLAKYAPPVPAPPPPAGALGASPPEAPAGDDWRTVAGDVTAQLTNTGPDDSGFGTEPTAGPAEETAPQTQADGPFPTSLGDAAKKAVDQGTGQAPDIPPLYFAGPARSAPFSPSKPTQSPQDVQDKITSGQPIGTEDFVSTATKSVGNQGTAQVFDEHGPSPQLGVPSLDLPASVGGAADGLSNAAQGVANGIGAGVGALKDHLPSTEDVGNALGSAAQTVGEYAKPGGLRGRGIPGLDAAADVMQGQIESAADAQTQANQATRRALDAYRNGQEPDPADLRAMSENSLNLAMGVSGEGPKIAQAAGAVTSKAARVAGQEIERLRLDKFPEGLRDTISQAAGRNDFWQTQRRGILPDAQVEKMADDLGRSVDQWISRGKAGRAYNAEETRALRNALTAQAVRVNETVTAIEQARATGEVTDALLADAIAAGSKMADLSRVAEGARAEAGRSLRAYQAFTRGVDASPADAIQRIFKVVGGREQAADLVGQYQRLVSQGADPYQMATFWSKVDRPPVGVGDWWQALRYNAMLSGPRTFEVNVIGNAAEVPWRLGRDAVASTVRGRPQELKPELAGMVEGARKGAQAFMQTLAHGITLDQAAAGEVPRSLSARVENPVGKGAALALEAPMRLLEGTDQFFRQMAYGMELGRWAGVTASKEGLRGARWSERVDQLMASPSQGAMKSALGVAERMTYKGEMGNFGNFLAAGQRIPVVGHILLPFLRTVYHITSRGIDRSPIGLLGTGIDVARGAYGDVNLLTRAGRKNLGDRLAGSTEGLPKGVVPLGERVSDNVVGSMAFVGLQMAAFNGYISGAGPEDREKRDMLRAEGWQPYSLKVGDRWVSYSNWGPIAVPLALAAGTAEASQYRTPKQDAPAVILDAFKRGAQVLTEQSYLQSVGALYKGMTEPDRYGEQLVEGLTNSVVPYGAAVNTVGQSTDPLVRESARSKDAGLLAALGQNLESRLPGQRESLPSKFDQLGRPVENQMQGAAAYLPLRTSRITPNATLETLRASGVDVPEAPRSVQGVALTPDEQRQVQVASGPLIEQMVAKATSSPRWAALSPAAKQNSLKLIVEAARENAGVRVLREMGRDQIRQRRTQAVATP